jgi:hypothetical protein
MPEALEASVGVDGKLAIEGEGSGQHLFPGGAPFGEAQVLHEDQFGRGEAVVHFGQGQLVAPACWYASMTAISHSGKWV